jgi:hypothetical protein
MPGIVRIADYIQILKRGERAQGRTPLEFLDEQIRTAEASLEEARHAVAAATRNREDARRLATDAEAVLLLARFYRFKVGAAVAKALADSHLDERANSAACLTGLRASVEQYRKLTRLTTETYDSMTDVPAWDPVHDLPCPYHWSDLLPVFEKELVAMEHDAPAQARR